MEHVTLVDLLQAVTAVIAQAAALMGFAVLIVAYAVARYLSMLRLRSLVETIKLGLGEEQRATLEPSILNVIKTRLERLGKSYVNKYSRMGRFHRIVFILGSIFALITVLLLLVVSSWDFGTDVLTTMAADLVVSSTQGFNKVLNSLTSFTVVAILTAAAVTLLIMLAQFIIRRLSCVWQIARGAKGVGEPDRIDRYDTVICASAVLLPLLVVGLAAFTYRHNGTMSNFAGRIATCYPSLVHPSHSVSNSQAAQEERDFGQVDSILFECLNSSSMLGDDTTLFCAAFIGHFLRTPTTSADSANTDVAVTAHVLRRIQPDSASLVLLIEAYDSPSNHKRVKNLVDEVRFQAEYGADDTSKDFLEEYRRLFGEPNT